MTKIYCAPEVANFEMWGGAADIFSLGCVFLEVQTVLCGRTIEELKDFRTDHEDDTVDMSFQANLSRVLDWCSNLQRDRPVFVIDSEDVLKYDIFASYWRDATFSGSLDHHSLARRHEGCAVIQIMLDRDPQKRPTAAVLSSQLGRNNCCRTGPEPFIVASDLQPNNVDECQRIDSLLDKQSFLAGRTQ